MFITACSWVIPELLGVDTTNVLDAQHPQLDTKNALWTHTRYMYLSKPHVPLTCCPVSLANTGSFRRMKDQGDCVTLSRVLSQLLTVYGSEF